MANAGAHGLQAYDHQVGGHKTQGGLAASLLDSNGRFLKQLQSGERGDREVQLYAHMERLRSSAEAGSSDGRAAISSEQLSSGGCALLNGVERQPEEDSHLPALCRWIPKSYGTVPIESHLYLAMEDQCCGYTLPCVMDAKIGMRTWYPWATQKNIEKYRSKDENSTQCTLGFRICGIKAQRADGTQWSADRHWGKGLGHQDVLEAMTKFGDNGALTASDVFEPMLRELRAMAKVFEHQQYYHFYSASVLLLYEGAAKCAADARPAVSLIDFAHTFPADAHDGGPDLNFLAGLKGLITTIEAVISTEGV